MAYVPAAQVVHAVSPVLGATSPKSQSWHEVRPVLGAMVLGGHSVHSAPATENLPLAHVVQADCPAALSVPAVQLVHAEDPAEGALAPAAQGWQDACVAPVCER